MTAATALPSLVDASCYGDSNDMTIQKNDNNNLAMPLLPTIRIENSIEVKSFSQTMELENDQEIPASTNCSVINITFLGFGFFLGLIVQLTTLGSYSLLVKRAATAVITSSEEISSSPSSLSENSAFFIIVFKLLSKTDICVYAFIWILFVILTTNFGLRHLRAHCQNDNNNNNNKQRWTRETATAGGINCLFGIVIGSFCGWVAINLMLGLSVSLLPYLSTAGFDILLCVVIYYCCRCVENEASNHQKVEATQEEEEEDDNDQIESEQCDFIC